MPTIVSENLLISASLYPYGNVTRFPEPEHVCGTTIAFNGKALVQPAQGAPTVDTFSFHSRNVTPTEWRQFCTDGVVVLGEFASRMMVGGAVAPALAVQGDTVKWMRGEHGGPPENTVAFCGAEEWRAVARAAAGLTMREWACRRRALCRLLKSEQRRSETEWASGGAAPITDGTELATALANKANQWNAYLERIRACIGRLSEALAAHSVVSK